MREIARETGFALDTADAVQIGRRLRHLPAADLARISPAMLRRAAGNLRAAAYSLRYAADRFDHRADELDAARQAPAP